jgi:putative phosphoribosyl transferase
MMIFERISRNFQLKFKDRVSAASILADTTKSSVRKEAKNDTLVFGIPRGGVITADILASRLNIPNFDIITPRKLTDPDNKEQAIGSIMEDGTTYLDEQQIRDSGISSDYIEKEKLTQIAEIKRRTEVYHSKERRYRNSVNSTIILVDDGAATGATAIVAARWIRKVIRPIFFIIAVAVAPKQTVKLLERECDLVKVVISPMNFRSVGQFYQDFGMVTDEQVISVIRKRDQ